MQIGTWTESRGVVLGDPEVNVNGGDSTQGVDKAGVARGASANKDEL
jgi:hypothetical protein